PDGHRDRQRTRGWPGSGHLADLRPGCSRDHARYRSVPLFLVSPLRGGHDRQARSGRCGEVRCRIRCRRQYRRQHGGHVAARAARVAMTAPFPLREFEVAAQTTTTFGRVLCSARQHHWIVDGPAYNNCPGEELTPPELFLSGVASCGVELVTVIAKEQGRSVGDVHLRVHGVVDRNRQTRNDVTV